MRMSGTSRPANSLAPGATGVDLTLSGTLDVGGHATLASLKVLGTSELVDDVIIGGGIGAGVALTVGGDVRATGEVQAPTLFGSTAVEFPAGASPGVRCRTDTDTGIAASGANGMTLNAGGFSWWSVLVGSVQTANNASLLTTGAIIHQPRTVDIDAVGDQLPNVSTTSAEVEITLSAGSIVSTATPFIPDGSNGQRVWLRVIDGDTLTLSDEGTLPGSNLHLGANTRALTNRDYMGLEFSTAGGGWCEILFTNIL